MSVLFVPKLPAPLIYTHNIYVCTYINTHGIVMLSITLISHGLLLNLSTLVRIDSYKNNSQSYFIWSFSKSDNTYVIIQILDLCQIDFNVLRAV